MDSNKEIGMLLRQERQKKGLSLEEVAEAINVSKQTLSNWERGIHRVGEECIDKLERILGISNIRTMFRQGVKNNMSIKALEEIKTLDELSGVVEILVNSLVIDAIYENSIRKMVKMALFTALGYEVYYQDMRRPKEEDEITACWECVAEYLDSLVDKRDIYPIPSKELSLSSTQMPLICRKLEWMAFQIGGELFEDFDDDGYRNDYIQQVGKIGQKSGYNLANIISNNMDGLMVAFTLAIYDLSSVLGMDYTDAIV